MTRQEPPKEGPWVERWLSSARFGAYIRACSGDRNQALALYGWNASVAAAFQRDLGHLEVALRNAYDSAVSSRWSGRRNWLIDPLSPVQARLIRRGVDINVRNRDQITLASNRAGGQTSPIGKTIAELPFGFWRYLTTSAHEKTLWVPYLHFAYPRGTDRLSIDRTLSALNQLRNRIAHMEPIFDRPLTQDLIRMMKLCELLDTTFAEYVHSTSTVYEQLGRRPG